MGVGVAGELKMNGVGVMAGVGDGVGVETGVGEGVGVGTGVGVGADLPQASATITIMPPRQRRRVTFIEATISACSRSLYEA